MSDWKIIVHKRRNNVLLILNIPDTSKYLKEGGEKPLNDKCLKKKQPFTKTPD